MRFVKRIASLLRSFFMNNDDYATPEMLRMESAGRIAALEVL